MFVQCLSEFWSWQKYFVMKAPSWHKMLHRELIRHFILLADSSLFFSGRFILCRYFFRFRCFLFFWYFWSFFFITFRFLWKITKSKKWTKLLVMEQKQNREITFGSNNPSRVKFIHLTAWNCDNRQLHPLWMTYYMKKKGCMVLYLTLKVFH